MNSFLMKSFLAAAILCGAAGVSAADFSVDGICYDVISASEMTCAVAQSDDGISYTGNIVIPETVVYQGNTYRVTEIGWGAFRNSAVLSVSLPGSVTTIESSAFSGCANIRDFTVPSSVTSIESFAFDNCTGLRTLTFEDGTEPLLVGSNFSSDNGETGLFHDAPVTTVYLGRDIEYDDPGYQYEEPFVDMEQLKEVTIGSTVTKIGERLFYSCGSLSRVNFAENGNLRSIGSFAFSTSFELASVVLPEGVTEIGDGAFLYCANLSSVVLPSTLTSLGSSAFNSCSNLSGTVVIPDGVTEIKDDTFTLCGKLTGVVLPERLTAVGDRAFYDCALLSDINLPESLTSIGAEAFYGCTGITSINISDNVTTIGEGAFYGCTGLTSVTVGDSVKELSGSLFYGCSNIESVTVSAGVGKICDWAFYGCKKLKDVVIEDGTAPIELGYNVGDRYTDPQYALFYGCPVETFYMGRDINYEEPKFPGAERGDEYICPFDGNTTLRMVTVGDNVKAIPEKLFENCATLESVTVGSGVATIGGKAFDGCTALKAVRISDVGAWCGIDFAELVSNPLYYAHNLYLADKLLTNLDIPSGTVAVKDYAFAGGACLNAVSVPSSVMSLGYQSFKECANISSVTIADGTASLSVGYDTFADGSNGVGLFAASKNIGSLYLGRNLVYDADAAHGYSPFYGTGLSGLQFGGNVTEIGDYLFYGCPVASSVDLPSGLKVIGMYAFDGALTESVTIPGTVETIYDGAFNNCTQLSSLTIEDSEATLNLSSKVEAEVFDKPVFFSGSKVGAVYVGRPVYFEMYGDNGAPFAGSTGLTDVTIGGYMTEVPKAMFYNCPLLENINLSENVTVINQAAFSNCTALKEISIPGNVVLADYGCFSSCDALEKIIVEEGPAKLNLKNVQDNKNVKELYIGRDLKPSGISFGSLSPIEKLTFGKNVAELIDDYYYKMPYIREVYSENPVPPVARVPEGHGVHYFDVATYENAVLYIPKGSLDAYRTAEAWKNFVNIVEYFGVDGGVESAIVDGRVSVTVSGGQIIVEGASDGAVVDVYNIAGQRVYSGTATSIALDRGLYIVRVAGSTFKVAL